MPLLKYSTKTVGGSKLRRSQKFDRCGVELEERYEEQRVLRVRLPDL